MRELGRDPLTSLGRCLWILAVLLPGSGVHAQQPTLGLVGGRIIDGFGEYARPLI